MVTFDEEGFVKIVDRIKDIIENGGKWISSVDLENNLMAQEAMVIAVPHLEWRERSIACAVIEEGKTVAKRELYDFL
ncbi:acyl-CoA synthetase (AMP-forming)/AMP-acid ligase II [Anoxybacillus caldiproteolyticus]|uniref:Acyl-CoA synthetase (AMP-forming)/AMP-acid ligase II n=1 Tax=Thermaerobacillus caldiproteolyticus TaxID=247480 RepID=A0A7V9Z9A7_9BACL|nr:acyl-CoA synthetase (AMP-forming)/AMP-acid ligase II [Anoxybacillus caldiproteolyticus]